MAYTDLEIAQLALEDLEVLGFPFTYEALAKAQSLAARARQRLVSNGGWNPRIYADAMADDAMIEYVKVALSGTPAAANKEFMRLAQAWTKFAAISFHNAIDEEVVADPLAVVGLTPKLYLKNKDEYGKQRSIYRTDELIGRGVVFLNLKDPAPDVPVLVRDQKYRIIASSGVKERAQDPTLVLTLDTDFYYAEIYQMEGVALKIVEH